MVLVITGSPGVGKHTIARKMLQSNNYQLLDINKIAFDAKIVEKNQDGIEVDVFNMKKHLKPLLSKKSLVVGHLAPYVIDSKDANFVIVLRKNPYQLIDIYKERQYSEKKIKDNLGSEILGIITNDAINNFGEEKTFQIDASNSTVESIASKIKNIINKSDNGDNIDWLPLIQEKNDFKTFFEY